MPPTASAALDTPRVTAPTRPAQHVRPRPATPVASDPVFVDPTGRRQNRVRAAVLGAVVAVVALLTAAVAGVSTGAGAPVHWEPGARADVSVVSR